MARKVIDFTISTEGRDLGKVFRITEMPSLKSELWAIRAFLAMARAGIELPDDLKALGMAGFATLGLKSLGGITYDEALPLLNEMFSCIQIIPPSGVPRNVQENGNAGDDIEEVQTRLQLRKAVFDLHINFSTPVAP